MDHSPSLWQNDDSPLKRGKLCQLLFLNDGQLSYMYLMYL